MTKRNGSRKGERREVKGRLARFLLPAFEIPLRANSHRERERHLGTRQTWNRAKIRIQQEPAYPAIVAGMDTWEASVSNLPIIFPYPSNTVPGREAAWPSGQRVGLAIRRSRVRVPLWPLAGFVLGRPEFKFSAMLANSKLVAFCQLGFLILLCCI